MAQDEERVQEPQRTSKTVIVNDGETGEVVSYGVWQFSLIGKRGWMKGNKVVLTSQGCEWFRDQGRFW